MIQRGGEAIMERLDKVQHVTIEPLINAMMAPGTGVYTDDDDL